MAHLNRPPLMPIENIMNQCQVDAKVDMARLVRDVFAIADQIVEQAHNTRMDEPRVVGQELNQWYQLVMNNALAM
jgi:hypothetical protein